MKIGLRIDVDTFRGTRRGVPNLIQLFSDLAISASFFFSVGPDNMGRHIWRLVRPSFLRKMMRSRAGRLYGWNILLKGTFCSGPVIGEHLGGIIRSARDAGHEVGLHAWDHYAWQRHMEKMGSKSIYLSLKRGFESLGHILECPPECSAVPGWRCNDLTLLEKAKFPFRYNSDCRGGGIFYPLVDGMVLQQPQIPVTMPTYDEVIGLNGVSHRNYNEYILSFLNPKGPNVLAVHAEVEGIACYAMFESFLNTALSRGISFIPLGVYLKGHTSIGHGRIISRPVQGREGWVSWQSKSKEPAGIER